MIPRLWLPVSSWPLGPSGKTDRKRLTAACEALSPAMVMEFQRPPGISDHDVEPVTLTGTETVIRDAWVQVLGKGDSVTIRPQDDFFKLGGDSLSTIMLISVLRARRLHMTAQEIFATRSLRKMAHLINSRTVADGTVRTGSSSSSKDNADWSCLSSSSSQRLSIDSGVAGINSSSEPVTSDSDRIEQPSSSLSKNEKCLRDLWATVLRRPEESFGAHDNFFKSGGDDMAALRLSRVASEANICLTGADIYAYPTLSEMARCIQRDRNDRSAEDVIPSCSRDVSSIVVGQADIEDILRASHMQLLYIIEGARWARTYYVWFWLKLDVSSPVDRVHEACNVVTQRHPILRTSFHLIHRKCYQAIRKRACDFKVLFYNDGFPDQICARLDQDTKHPVRFEKVLT